MSPIPGDATILIPFGFSYLTYHEFLKALYSAPVPLDSLSITELLSASTKQSKKIEPTTVRVKGTAICLSPSYNPGWLCTNAHGSAAFTFEGQEAPGQTWVFWRWRKIFSETRRDTQQCILRTSSHAQVNASIVDGWRAPNRNQDTTRFHATAWRFKELARKFWRFLGKN